jgi:hypothetical protein
LSGYEDLEQEDLRGEDVEYHHTPIDYETFDIEFDGHGEFSACYKQLEKLLKFYFKRSEVKIEFVKDEKELKLSLRAHTSNRKEIQEIKMMITWAMKRASQSFQSEKRGKQEEEGEGEDEDDDHHHYYSHDDENEAKGQGEQRKSTSKPLSRTNKDWAYEVLELPRGADRQRVRNSYLRLMKDFHPDKFIKGTPAMRKLVEDKVKDINAAYEFLSG